MSQILPQGRLPLSTWISKGYALVLISAIEIGAPFVRMLVLTRFLDLRELGFASALAATYSTLEQMSDIAMHRFVFSARRDEYDAALASAHALSLVRGLVVGALALAVSPAIATALSLRADWPSFAWLGPIVVIRSFEHLAPRVAERDYRYDAQLKVSLASSGLGFAAMFLMAYRLGSHDALMMSLLGHAVGLVAASHWLAGAPYRVSFGSPQFSRAFQFGFPLMFNGIGLALSGQGDRFLVGAALGLPALGVYSVALLVTVVPITMVFRLMGSLSLAAFHNASVERGELWPRIKIAARLSPYVAAIYALGIVTLMNIVVPIVFGAQFVVSRGALALLALAAFFRIIRVEPYTSLLLHERRTRRLALANLSVLSGLLFAALIMAFHPVFEAALAGRLLGEMMGLAVFTFLARDLLGKSVIDFWLSAVAGFTLAASAIAGLFVFSLGFEAGSSARALGVYALFAVGWGAYIGAASARS